MRVVNIEHASVVSRGAGLIYVKRRQSDNDIVNQFERRAAVMWTLQNSSENSGGNYAVLWMTMAGIAIAACLAVTM